MTNREALHALNRGLQHMLCHIEDEEFIMRMSDPNCDFQKALDIVGKLLMEAPDAEH